MTDLHKPIKRRTDATVRDGGKARRIVVTLYPGNTIGLRQEKTRREELISIEAAYSLAVKMRVAKEQAEKRKGGKRTMRRRGLKTG